MSDEEDTAILLDTERTSTEKEIKISPKQDTYQDAAQSNISSQTQLILSSVVAIVSGICFGYDMGIAANLIKPISSTLNLNCAEQFYITSTWLLGAILSSIFGGFVVDTCGRRWSVLCSASLLIFSAILSSLPDSFALLLCSRLISGFSGPLSGISQCIYMSETSDPRYRGFRISLHQLGASLGGLLTCVAGLYIGPDSDTWRVAMGLNGLPALAVVLLTLIWLPRSPHFILYQRAQSVKRRSPNYRITILVEVFIVAVLLIVFQQLSGRYTVFFYAPRLFSLLGICSSQAARIAVTTFSVVRVSPICLYHEILSITKECMFPVFVYMPVLVHSRPIRTSHISDNEFDYYDDFCSFLSTSGLNRRFRALNFSFISRKLPQDCCIRFYWILNSAPY